MPDPEVYVALAMEAAGIQSMLGDLLGRLDVAGADVEVDDEVELQLHRARAMLQALGSSLTEQAHRAAMRGRPVQDVPLVTERHDWPAQTGNSGPR